MVSHVCSQAISNARINARMSQQQLATACNEKAAAIIALENGSARYDAGLINRIETALKVQIPRGRTKNKGRKKKWINQFWNLHQCQKYLKF